MIWIRILQTACQAVVAGLLVPWARPLFLTIRPTLASFLGLGYVEPTADDNSRIALAMVISSAVVCLVHNLCNEGHFFSSGRRFVNEVYAATLAFGLATLYVFIGSTIIFAPTYFLAYFLVMLAVYGVVYLVGRLLFFRPSPDAAGAAHGTSDGVVRSAARSFVSIRHLLVLAIAALPAELCVLYKVDDRLAASINYVRSYLDTPYTRDWTFVDMFPGEVFEQPLAVDQAKDSGAFFVLERPGRLVKMVAEEKETQRELMLDFSSLVGEFEVENGALGFALHPNFTLRPRAGDSASSNGAPVNGYVYVYYTVPLEGKQQANRLVRFDLSEPTLQERLESQAILIEQRRPGHGFHNAGDVVFGPDGFLYVSIGEAMYAPGWQSITNGFYGGVFRIDVDMTGGDVSHPIRKQPIDGHTSDYFIPSENPFVGRPDALEEYLVLGLRNPFRIGFDPVTGQLWVSENGSSTWEEIIDVQAGDNCQFPVYEGPDRQSEARIERPDEWVGNDKPPYYTYRHTAIERSVIGGGVYRGSKNAGLYGAYLYGDNGSGRFYGIRVDEHDPPEPELLALIPFQGQAGLSSVFVTRQEDVLVTVLGSHTSPSGRVLKITHASGAAGVIEVKSAPVLTTMSEQEFFLKYCALCHGDEGRGDGLRATDFKKRPKDFTDAAWQESVQDDHIFKVIEGGGAAAALSNDMPSFALVLKPDEIEKMVAYVRSLKQ